MEFLKREEVRTMAKDIAKVREKQAKKEQERIASFKEEVNLPQKPQVVLSQHPEEKPKTVSKSPTEVPPALGTFQRLRGSSAESTRPSQAIDSDPAGVKQLTPAPKKQEPQKRPLVPRRPLRRSEKLFIRVVVGGIFVFLIFNAVAFGFWYFFKRDAQKEPEPKNIQQEVGEAPLPPVAPKPQEEQPQPPEDSLPQAKTPAFFFEAPEQELIIETPEELLRKLQDFLQENPALGFTNLAVKVKEDILSPQEFLEGTTITMPQELKEKLTENLMLFSYVAENKKRLGFIAELKETENISELLQSWEQSMEQDLASFFNIIGDKGLAYTPLFRSSVYQEIPVRFQTFSVIDFGIVYGVIDNKLLLTSSFESFQRATDLLKAI